MLNETPKRKWILSGLAAALALFAAGPHVAKAEPSGYPADYAKLADASKKEDRLLIYSNVGEVNWRPVIAAFNEQYPWVKVQTLDLGGSEVFERYYAEQGSGTNQVDMVVSNSGAIWLDFLGKNNVANYVSPEAPNLPSWSIPQPGVYTLSTDPYVIVYNKLLLPPDQWPKSLNDIYNLVKADPAKFNKKIATLRPMTNSNIQSNNAHFIDHIGESKALEMFSFLGPMSDLYRSAGPIFEKITTGEYLAAYSVSAVQLLPLLADPNRAKIIGWAFPSDGTIMMMRHAAITATAKSPASARLFLDFLVSKRGQEAVSAGGLMPYRSDVDVPAPPKGYKYQDAVDAVGPEQIIRSTFNPALMSPTPELIAKVRTAFKISE